MEELKFAAESKVNNRHINGAWKIIVADDEQGVHDITRMALGSLSYNGKGLSFISTYSGSETIRFMEENSDIALVLLDIVMEEDDSGLQVAKYIRNNLMNDSVRIILRTGQSGHAPEEKVVVDYDINDYKTKNELTTEKLFTSVICALRSYSELIKKEQMQDELKQINEHLDDLVRERTSQLANTNDHLMQEIIERKRAEKKKQELLEKLEQTFEELKHSQEQLIQSEKMASLGQLAAGIAHEINNPLGFVNSNLENLKKYLVRILGLVEGYGEIELSKEKSIKIIRYKKEINYDYLKTRMGYIIERSLKGLERIKNIIEDLKTFSRLDAADISDVNINESIDITLNMLLYEFKNRINIIKEYGDIPLMSCCSAKLNQVFLNILINACQAIEGKGEIRITTFVEGKTIRIEISDTGKGIPEDIRSKIFDPFFTTKPVGSGTGLGLSISHRIINDHNGKILVHSADGEGTTFVIEMPIP